MAEKIPKKTARPTEDSTASDTQKPKRKLTPLKQEGKAPRTDYRGKTPYQWFEHMTRQLMAEQPWLQEDLDYVSGNHPLPEPDQRYAKALKSIREQARTNIYGMLTMAPIERMNFLGIRVGTEGKADEDAKFIWAASNFDYQFQYVKKHAATHGRGYILVSPPTEDQKWPILTYQDPRMCITVQDPLNPTKSIAGLQLWVDPVKGETFAVVYLDDTIHFYRGSSVDPIALIERGRDGLSPADAAESGAFVTGPVLKNPLGECPLVMIPWQPDGKSQCGDLKDMQDRINTTTLLRLVITKNQAFRQRWLAGAAPKKGSKNKKGPGFDPAADVLWVTDNPEAKFGDFAQADIRQVLEANEQDIQTMASIAKTPPHYLMGTVSNVSGETITAAESAFISMVKARLACVGWGVARALKLAFKYLGDTEKAEEVDCEVIWDNPEVRTLAEISDAMVKQAQVLMDSPPYVLRLVMPQMGFAPDEVEFAVGEAEKFQAEQKAREEEMMQSQFDQQEKLGKMGVAQKAAGAAGSPKTAGAKAAKKPAPGAQGRRAGSNPASPKAKSPGGK